MEWSYCFSPFNRQTYNFKAKRSAIARTTYFFIRLGKRDFLYEYLDRQWIQHQRWNKKHSTKLPLSVIWCDIDRLRRFSNRYGYLCSDRILRNIGDVFNNFNRYPWRW